VTIAGRVLLKRKLGRIGFATLRDGSGDLQVLVTCGSTISTSVITSASPAR
jgi:lysyl-tRNA synthetase class 2